MKNFLPKIQTVLRALAVASIVAFPLYGSLTAHAAQNAQFSLTPTPQSGTTGSAITLTLMMNSGGNSIFVWKADLAYSASYFSSVSVATAAGSPFTGTPSVDVTSGGNISISRYSTTASTYSGAVATITLQSNGTAGSSSLDFKPVCASTADTSNCSAIADGANNELLHDVAGGTIAVTAPAPASGGGGSAGGSSGSSSAGGSATKKSISFAPKAPTTSAAPTVAAPKTTTTTTSTGDEISVADGTVTIAVLDQNNKPVPNAVVTIGSVKGTTDKSGRVTLRGLTPGTRSGTISYGGKSRTISVKVTSGSIATQKFTIQTKNTSAVVPISLAVLMLIIIGALAFLFLDHGRNLKRVLGKFRKTPSGLDPDLQFHAPTAAPIAPAPTPVTHAAKPELPAKPLPIAPAPAPTHVAVAPPITPPTSEAPAPSPPRPSRPITQRGTASLHERAMAPGTIVRPTIDDFHRA